MIPVVVGGGSGIGRGIVESYQAIGASPLVWDIAAPYDIECDVTDPDSVQNALTRTVEQVGVPDQLSITAGIGHSGLLVEETVESWDRVMAVNTRGPWLVMRTMARAWIDQDRRGSIVATSSVSAHLVDRAMGLYCASKSALSTIVRVAALEWAPFGIRVNGVGPGVTDTPMLDRSPAGSGWLQAVADRTALGRLGQPTDIAQAVLALHDLPWVTGQILDCDGGLSLHSPIDWFEEAKRAPGGT